MDMDIDELMDFQSPLTSNENLKQQISILEQKLQNYDRQYKKKVKYFYDKQVKSLEVQVQNLTDTNNLMSFKNSQMEINLSSFMKSCEQQNLRLEQLQIENYQMQDDYAHIAQFKLKHDQMQQQVTKYQQSSLKKKQRLKYISLELLELKNQILLQEQKVLRDCDNQIQGVQNQHNQMQQSLRDKTDHLQFNESEMEILTNEIYQLQSQLQEANEVNEQFQSKIQQLVIVDNELQDLIHWLQDIEKPIITNKFTHPVLKSLSIILTRLFEKNKKSKQQKEKLKLQLQQLMDYNNTRDEQTHKQINDEKSHQQYLGGNSKNKEHIDMDMVKQIVDKELKQQICFIKDELDNQNITFQEKYNDLEYQVHQKDEILKQSETRVIQLSNIISLTQDNNMDNYGLLQSKKNSLHESEKRFNLNLEQYENLFQGQETKVKGIEIQMNEIYKLIESLND